MASGVPLLAAPPAPQEDLENLLSIRSQIALLETILRTEAGRVFRGAYIMYVLVLWRRLRQHQRRRLDAGAADLASILRDELAGEIHTLALLCAFALHFVAPALAARIARHSARSINRVVNAPIPFYLCT